MQWNLNQYNILKDIINISKLMQSQENKRGGSLWSSQLNWMSNHLNKLWKAKHQQSQPNAVVKIQQKLQISGLKRTMKQQQQKMDAKTQILNSLRSQNFKPNLQDKLKRVSNYFSRKEKHEDKPCDLVCPICLQFLIKPVTTVCGHNFCLRCLDQTLLFKTDCPNCRHYIRGTKCIQGESLSKIILRIISKYSEQQIQVYNEYLAECQEWTRHRKLSIQDIEIGDIIDVRDTQYIWCKAQIRQLYIKNNRITSILVHYLGWNSIYDEIIQADSDRLSTDGFYTDRNEIPHYRNNSNNINEDRMYSFVVNGESDQMNNINLEIDINLDVEYVDAREDQLNFDNFQNNEIDLNLEDIDQVENQDEDDHQVQPQIQIQEQPEIGVDVLNQDNWNQDAGYLGINSNQNSINQQINNQYIGQQEVNDNEQINNNINVNINQADSVEPEIQVQEHIIQVGPFVFSINNNRNTATYITALSHQSHNHTQDHHHKPNQQKEEQQKDNGSVAQDKGDDDGKIEDHIMMIKIKEEIKNPEDIQQSKILNSEVTIDKNSESQSLI